MVAGCAECCFVIKEFEAEDEAAFRKKKRRGRSSRKRYEKRRWKARLADEEFDRTGALHATERRLLELKRLEDETLSASSS